MLRLRKSSSADEASWLQDESSDDDEPGGTLAALRRARLNFPKTTVQGQLDREKEFDSLVLLLCCFT